MPCPEVFKESLKRFGVAAELQNQINDGFEDLISSSKQKRKAEYFKRATDILDKKLDFGTKAEIMEYNSCCKTGSRLKTSKVFAQKYKDLTLEEKIAKVPEMPNMGKPILESGKIRTGIFYSSGEKYKCACPNFHNIKEELSVSGTYCLCCAGHFKFHYELALGIKLKTLGIISTPLGSLGQSPCVIEFEVL